MTTTLPDHACGDACGDYSLSRRSLLQRAALAGAAGAVTTVLGDAVTQTVFGATPGRQNVLVLLSLRGGADGLSMVMPYNDPAWKAARRTLLPSGGATPLQGDGTFGLHPKFAPLEQMWRDKKFAAVHAVGLPVPNRSHFEAMELIEDADPTSSARVGWLNRMIGELAGDDPFQGVHLTSAQAPTVLYGPAPTVSASDLDALTLPLSGTKDEGARRQAAATRTALNGLYGSGRLAGAGRTAMKVADTAKVAASSSNADPANGAVYTNDGLGRSLARTAGVIRSGAGARAISIDYGSWDHHEGVQWRMSSMVENLAKNLAAFFTDLGTLGDDVTLLTLSEFGRRMSPNGSAGLDHGHGNCVLALGGGVQGGTYYGRLPDLGTATRPADDLQVTTDWRNVLSEVLNRRFTDVRLSSVFPGHTGYSDAGRLGFMA